jgi:MFS family permease
MKLDALKLPDFRVTLLTRFCVMMSWLAGDVIIGWQVYSITKDPLMLGLVGLTEAVPALLCALFAGHVVDISRPYKVFVICVLVMCLNSLTLLLIGGGYTNIQNILPWLFAGIFVSGLTRAFIMPSSFALLPQIVPKNLMASASAMLTGNFQLASVLGPALAGLIYGGYGASTAWLMPISFITTALVLQLIALSPHPKKWKSPEKREPAFKSITNGWKFIFKNRTLLSIMTLDMFAVLFGGAVAMLPAIADQVLHVGPEELGLLRAAPALGAVAMALILSVRPFKTINASWMLWTVAGFGLGIIGFGLSQVFWLSMLFLFITGVFDSISMVIRSTLMQWLTPDNMRGRVSSVNSMFIVSSNEIGAFESGVAARLLGLVPSIIFGGCMTLAVVAITALASPKLRKLKVTPND